MKAIPLTKGLVALVDDEDYEIINCYKWWAHHSNKHSNTYYAMAQERVNRKVKTHQMHRLILGLFDPKIQVDHIDHNGLNNQRSNLRICTNTNNQQNKKPRNDNKLGVKGVSKRGNKYIAEVYFNHKRVYKKSFNTIEEAALAYNSKALEYHGEFAYLNSVCVGSS